jgi:hypothetical protein
MRYRSYYIFLLCFCLTSCDNLEDYYSKINESPIIEFIGMPTGPISQINDSLKVGYSYSIKYQIHDEENLSLTYPKSENFLVSDSSNMISIKGLKESTDQIIFSATDSYLKKGQAQLNLTIFNNLPPVAILSYQITEFDGSYFITLDGSQSYDLDAKFGGKVMNYEFSINNYTKVANGSILKYSVNKDAFYTIKFRVKDNNDQWSNQILQYIKI